MSISVTNAGPDAEDAARPADRLVPEHVELGRGRGEARAPRQGEARVVTDHPFLGPLEIVSDGEPTLLFCENETNDAAALRVAHRDEVPEGRDQRSRRRGAPTVSAESGSKAAFWHRITVAPGATATIRVRLRPPGVRRRALRPTSTRCWKAG